MRNLFRFIYRHNFFFLFLLLEALAIALTASYQHYHQSFFFNSANILTGRVYTVADNLGSYLSLRQENKLLAEENTHLLNMVKDNFLITDQDEFVKEDSLYRRRYHYMNARVINNSVNRRNNYFTLDKGRAQGIGPDMGVITTRGIAGLIVTASENFSVGMSLLHTDFQLSVMIKKDGNIGSLRWEGGNYRQAHMSYIPPHIELNRGDTVVTSGFSTIFPEGILIGTISDWEIRRGETFYTATVDLALDYNTLAEVYIVSNLLREEQQELEGSVIPGN